MAEQNKPQTEQDPEVAIASARREVKGTFFFGKPNAGPAFRNEGPCLPFGSSAARPSKTETSPTPPTVKFREQNTPERCVIR